MKRLLILVAVCCAALGSMAQIERPKLVVGVVVDQMRWDYLYYYYETALSACSTRATAVRTQ